MCTLKEAQVKYTPFQEVKLHPLGWSSAHSLDKSLASYKLSSRFSFRFWAIDERTPDTWCPRSCQRLESCPMLAVLLIKQRLGLVHFLYLIKQNGDTVGNNLLFLFWDSLSHFQTDSAPLK